MVIFHSHFVNWSTFSCWY